MSGYGAVPAPTPIRSYDYEICAGYESNTKDYPTKFTFPENLIPPVYNQGAVGACVGFSSCSCAESHFRKSGDNERLSPGFFYGRDECRGNHKGTGLYADTAMKGIIKIGFVPYHLYPILEEVPKALTLANERDDLLEYGKKKKPESYVCLAYALKDKMWDSIRTALYKDNCAVVIISHEYFGGSHAIMGIGYSDEKIVGKKRVKGRYVELQNSWGEEWSEDGRDLIPLEYVDDAYVFVWEPIKFPFTDVKETDWFYDDVRSVHLCGLVSGTTDTTFEPNANFIRGDVAMIVSRAIEKLEHSINTFIKSKRQQGLAVKTISFNKWTESTLPFRDISSADYYCKAVADVVANGIMNGKSDVEFDATATMTRAELCATAVRLIDAIVQKLKVSVPANYKLPNNEVEAFDDVKQQDWYYPYVQKACAYGIMKGNGDGTFAPNKDVIRCEGAAIFHRIFKLIDELLIQTI